ncbi:MAG: hypothetical protein ACT6S0_04800 [Roseateles sp.]|uniref:hypothetical protein n=1 Tax=Roseateles sp. TaxID=1971397 RepID=UPI0040363735
MSKVEEKYHRAAQSSHLEMRRTDEGQGDVETIIAAGLAETMGILLTRLRGEWDAAAGEVALTQRNAKRLQEARAAAVKAATPSKPFDAAAFDRDASAELLTARLLILTGLRSLEPAKQALFLFAHRQAPHKACESNEAALGKLVGQVLDVWLDKVCHHCNGVGFTGGYGSPRLMCMGKGKCGGSGSRRDGRLGANEAERLFGLFLLNVMDSRCAGSMKTVQRKTRQG